ncbi:MAG: hypothetical protein IJ074_12925 [Clostridia bacterium]|nr:hypothetical protein [Clostridia bacterium]
MIKRVVCVLIAVLFSTGWAFAEDWEWFAKSAPAGRLCGVSIGIDPGHQARQISEKEAVAPGSKEM